MTNDYDVVVVGARVAGAMTGLHLARAGHRVLIVDRAGPPADTLSTHALMRTAVVQLARAGILDGLTKAGTPPIRRMTLGFGSDVFSFDVRADYGVDALYAPRRTVLDALILGAAVAAGAEFETGRAVSDVLRDADGRVSGAVLGRRSETVVVRAAFVVGADGRNSTVARLVGAVDQRIDPPTAASVYAYYSGMPDTGFDFRFATDATAGSLRTNDDLTLVWAGVPVAHLSEPMETFHRVLSEVAPDISAFVKGASRVERFRFTTGITSFLREPFGAGWALVGDAGFTKDPLSAHGISCALRDAELLADAISDSLSATAVETIAGRRYHQLRDRFAVPLLSETSALASYQWGPEEASAIMRRLGSLTDAECEYLTQRAEQRVA